MEPDKKSNGSLIGLIVIIIILVLGGIYMWQSNKGTENTTPAPAGDVSESDSADLDALDKDLNSADIDVGANAVNSVQ